MSKELITSRNGQFFMQKILIFFASAVALFVLLSPLQSIISTSMGNYSANGGDSGTVIIVFLVPMFMVLGLIIYLFAFDRI